jgi:hypothetical protein
MIAVPKLALFHEVNYVHLLYDTRMGYNLETDN